MDTVATIRIKYLALHRALSIRYYRAHQLSKEEFDAQHGQLWNDMDAELLAAGYPSPLQPPRDLEAEIDDLKDRLQQLKTP